MSSLPAKTTVMGSTILRNVNEDSLPEAVQPAPAAHCRCDGDDSPFVVLPETDGKIRYNPEDAGLEVAPTPSSGKSQPRGLRGWMARRSNGVKGLALAVLVTLVAVIVAGTVFAVRSHMSSASSDDVSTTNGSAGGSTATSGTASPSPSPTESKIQGKPHLAVATVKTNQFIGGYYLYIFHQPASMMTNEIRLNRAADENFTWNGAAEETIPLSFQAKKGTPLAVIGRPADDEGNAVFDLFYLHVAAASSSTEIAHVRLNCDPIGGCINFGSSLVTSPSDMYKVEANEAALATSPFRSKKNGTQDMLLYYRTTSGGIAQKTLSYKSLTEDVTITSATLATGENTFLLSTMAAAEMPEQQYAIFFGDEESSLQTWWNETKWFGPLAWTPAESNAYWSRNLTLTACAHPRKFEYHALYADVHGGSITEMHQTGSLLDFSQEFPTYKNLTGLQLVDEGRGALAVSCFDDSLVLVYWSQGKLVYGIKANGTWTETMVL